MNPQIKSYIKPTNKNIQIKKRGGRESKSLPFLVPETDATESRALDRRGVTGGASNVGGDATESQALDRRGVTGGASNVGSNCGGGGRFGDVDSCSGE
ncbi:hypothetical protein LguiB_031950 [Lonicera macranthoides]